jgi:hypothetical protein
MNTLKHWRLAGIITITILGFVLHYLFSWTDSSKLIGLFTPVNESVWEHLKLGYWSVVLFSFIEYLQIKRTVNNYFFSKTIGVLTLEIAIIIIYYGYTLIAGKNIFWIDIGSYILGAIICQYLSYLFLKQKPYSKFINKISLLVFIGIGVSFAVTTYYTPHVALFKDNNNNTFGINNEK